MGQCQQRVALLLTRRHPRFARHAPPPRINAKTESHLRFVGQADGVCLGYGFLAAPDIDIDVFESQLRRFGKIKRPFYVVLARDDKALWLSGSLAGGVSRVGDDPRTAELAKLGAAVIDLTDVE